MQKLKKNEEKKGRKADSEYIYYMGSEMSPKVLCKLLVKIKIPSLRV